MSEDECEEVVDYKKLDDTFLFTDSEITKILARRNEYILRLDKPMRCVRDFLKLISFEYELVKNFADRSSKTIVVNLPKTKLLSTNLCKHIITIYDRAIFIYPLESKLYENVINFCIRTSQRERVPLYFSKWLHYYGDGGDVWFKLIKWCNNECQSISDVSDKTVAINPTEPAELYKNILKMELIEMSKLVNNRIEEPISLQCAEDIYYNATKEIPGIKYMLEILKMLEEYMFTKPLQNVIIQDLGKQYPTHFLTWHALAIRELKGFHLANMEIEANVLPDVRYVPDKIRMSKRINFCAKVYEFATTIVAGPEIWSHYLQTMIKLNKKQSNQTPSRRKYLLRVYNNIHNRFALPESHFLLYADLLMDKHDDHFVLEGFRKKKCSQVLNLATFRYPDSVDLWKLFLRHAIIEFCRDTVYEIFYTALKSITGARSLPLWKLIISYSISEFELGLDKVEEIYKEVIKQREPIRSHFKADYLEWTAIHRGILDTQKLFKELNKNKPYVFNTHTTMFRLNLSLCRLRRGKDNKDDDVVNGTRECLELARKLFGNNKSEVWIDSIKFVQDYGELKEVRSLYKQAKQTLPERIVKEFLVEYDKIKSTQGCSH